MEVIEEKSTYVNDTQPKHRPKRSVAPVTYMEVVKNESPPRASQIDVAKAIDSPTKTRSKKIVVAKEVSPLKTLKEISVKEVRAKRGLVMSEQKEVVKEKLSPVKLLETKSSLSQKEIIESHKNRRKTNIGVVKPSPEKELNPVSVLPTKTVRKTRLLTSNMHVVEDIQDNAVKSKSQLLKASTSTKEVVPQVDDEVVNAASTKKIPGLALLQNLKNRKSSSKIPGIESLTEIRRRKAVVPTNTQVTKTPRRSPIKKIDSPEMSRLIKTKRSPIKETKNTEVVINKLVRKTRLLAADVQEDLVKGIEDEIVSSKPRPLKRNAAMIEGASEVDCGNVDGPISKVAKAKDHTDVSISSKITKVKSRRPPIPTSSKVPGLNNIAEVRRRKSAIAVSLETPDVANASSVCDGRRGHQARGANERALEDDGHTSEDSLFCLANRA